MCVVRDKHSQVLPTIGAVVTAKVMHGLCKVFI